VTPPGEALKEGSLQVRTGSGIHQMSLEFGHAFRSDFIGSLGLASQNMGRVFRCIAPGTRVVILALPFHQRSAHSTIG